MPRRRPRWALANPRGEAHVDSCMGALADLIRRRRDAIVARWIEDVDARFGAARLTRPELRDSMPEFLDQLVAALAWLEHSAGPVPVAQAQQTARIHGEQRLRIGFDVHAVVLEYELLVRQILDRAVDEHCPVRLEELRVLHGMTFAAVAEAVAEYVARLGQHR